MMTKQLVVLVSLCLLLLMNMVGLAEAAGTGTLKYGFKFKDPATGVETALPYGFVYLHNATKPPPMEKFYSKADFIDCKSYGNGTYVNPNIPAGTYYIRITQRNPLLGHTEPQGPPRVGDYTWMQTTPITITAGQTLDIGTKYAYFYSSSPITVTGTVKTQKGVPLAGRYVRAQSEPCYKDGYNYNVNQCGPDKYIALMPTDADGKYTLELRDPGTYYLYTSPCLTDQYFEYTGNRCSETAAAAPITVKVGDSVNTDFVVWQYP